MGRNSFLPESPSPKSKGKRVVLALELIGVTKCPLCHSKPIALSQKSEYSSFGSEAFEQVTFACGAEIRFSRKDGYDAYRECGHLKDLFSEILKQTSDSSLEELISSTNPLFRSLAMIRRREEEEHERRLQKRNEVPTRKTKDFEFFGTGDP